jgi:hypothetical protein
VDAVRREVIAQHEAEFDVVVDDQDRGHGVSLGKENRLAGAWFRS